MFDTHKRLIKIAFFRTEIMTIIYQKPAKHRCEPNKSPEPLDNVLQMPTIKLETFLNAPSEVIDNMHTFILADGLNVCCDGCL